MITINPICAFSDNYIWHLQRDNEHWVVDPGEAGPVIEALGTQKLAGILLTHHHFDHTGGVADLVARYQCPVFGPPSIDGVTHPLTDGTEFSLMGSMANVIAVPGHTLDHIAIILRGEGKIHLFCGDTLFAAGCGRLFEGTPEQMHRSLSKLAELPADTLVYCAHEYTLANLKFAAVAEPGSEAVTARITTAQSLRQQDRPTLPSTIGLERDTNPFLRSEEPEIRRQAIRRGAKEDAKPVEIFATLRQWKDNF